MDALMDRFFTTSMANKSTLRPTSHEIADSGAPMSNTSTVQSTSREIADSGAPMSNTTTVQSTSREVNDSGTPMSNTTTVKSTNHEIKDSGAPIANIPFSGATIAQRRASRHRVSVITVSDHVASPPPLASVPEVL